MSTYATEVASGQRFEFGKNWTRFLRLLNDDRILTAEESLRDMLQVEDLTGLRFLDIGSGSGLFSLAARRLGATVTSFDFDPHSVACTAELRRRYFPEDENWTIREGSVLDRGLLESLGQFDVVYSWGVLHHTGAMWQALENVVANVEDGGQLFIALYNDQGLQTKIWRRLKKLYCTGIPGQVLVGCTVIPAFIGKFLIQDVLAFQNPLRRYTEYQKTRGMSFYYDWFDWLGGYPFEAATVSEVVDFYETHGFTPAKIEAIAGSGNNQFVFRKAAAATASGR